MAQDRKKVLVLGAGYAGLQTVTKLQKSDINRRSRNYAY
ncbi:conserved domain protein [Staphylococcus aureus subsp. aureus 21259]|nr:conserved domain protein [Staphylococcus aureus subsp. aureus 21259]